VPQIRINSKKLFGLLGSFILVLGFSFAVPAVEKTYNLVQPGGEEFKATQWGNEESHGWEKITGYTIKKDSDGVWEYAEKTQFGLKAGGTPAHRDPPKGIKKHIRPSKSSHQKISTSSDSGIKSVSTISDPSSKFNIPVIMINYADTSTDYTSNQFQNLLFGDDPSIATGPGSMQDFYEENSYGKFNVTAQPSGVLGWYQADENHDYYGSGDISSEAAELAREAVVAADSEIDYSKYDNNNDGEVEGVIVIHEGGGEEATGDSSDIWSHRWAFSDYTTDDGVYIDDYSLQPELYNSQMSTMGVYAHEFGHLVGLPDLYDTDYSSSGLGDWALMAGGSWNSVNRQGDSPAHLTVWSKKKLGWLEPDNINGRKGYINLSAIQNEPDAVQWNYTHEEYFMSANRQQNGFDVALPGSGLIMYHVDDTQNDNTDENNYWVDIEEAHGLTQDLEEGSNADEDDLFSSDLDGFSTSTDPNSSAYGNTPTGFKLTDISSSGYYMTANAGDISTPNIQSTSPNTNIDDAKSPKQFELNITNFKSGTTAKIFLNNNEHVIWSSSGQTEGSIPLNIPNGNNTARFKVFNSSNEAQYSEKEIYLFRDKEKPNLTAVSPINGSNISGTFDIRALWSERISEIASSKFVLNNSNYSQRNSLNATIDSATLEDDIYDITYNVSDTYGNYNVSEVTVDIDNTKPSLLSTYPDATYLSANFSINATWKDSQTGVKEARYIFSNSSIQKTGELNKTIDTSDIADGKYDIKYSLEDYAGNFLNNTIEVFLDTKGPSLDVIEPINQTYLRKDFNASAKIVDELSGVNKSNYSISNQSYESGGTLNDTINTSKLAEAEYNITYMSEDNVGNIESVKINVTLDKTKPRLNITSPASTDIKGNFSINATVSDNLSKINTSQYILENNTIQEKGELNSTLNSSKYADGRYNITATATDNAGNINNSKRTIHIDNTPPRIAKSSGSKNANLSGVQDVNISFSEATKVSASRIKLYNMSGNLTDWKKLNTTINTTKYADGAYNLTINANDTLQNNKTVNYSLEIDNKKPDLNIKGYNLTEKYIDWNKDNKTVQASCSDTETGFQRTEVSNLSTTKTPHNFTLSSTGKINYNFTCLDYAENQHKINVTYKIDGQSPNITSINPSNNAQTGRNPTITANFINESKQSGLNLTKSNITSTKGSIDTTYTNSSFTSDISGLSYSDNYKLDIKLTDNLNHTFNTTYHYNVKSEPEDTGTEQGSDPGGPPGGPIPPSTNTEQNETQTNQTENKTRSNQTESSQTVLNQTDTSSDEELVDAVNPEQTRCKTFKQSEKLDGWQIVEECGQWERETAEELIEQVSNTTEQDKLAEAQSQYEKGNYTGAIDLASDLRQKEEQKIANTLNNYILPASIAVALATLGLIFAYFLLRRKLVEELTKISTGIKMDERTGKEVDEKVLVELSQAEKQLKEGELLELWKKIRELRKLRS